MGVEIGRSRRWAASFVALALVGGVAACASILGVESGVLDTDGGGGADGEADTGAGDATGHDGQPGADSGDAGLADSGFDGGAMEAGSPVFTVTPSPIALQPDASVAVQVSVQRNGSLPGALSIDFTMLPTGVTATPGAIAADAGAGSIKLMAAASAPPGAATVDLQANGTTYSTVPLVVYGASGTIDVTFQGGYVSDKADAAAGAIFNAVSVDAQGGIIAGGALSGGGWLLRRYLPDGTDDMTFDGNAAAAIPSTGSLKGLAIDPTTNDIIGVGVGTSSELAVVVLTSSGTANGAFNGGVPFTLTPAMTNGSSGNAVTVVAGQQFLVAGNATPAPYAVLTQPLSENQTPPSGGIFAYTQQTTGTSFNAAAVDPMGRVIVAGSEPGGGVTPVVARFSATGSLDSTFGDGGLGTTSGFPCRGDGLAVRPKSGSIFVSGADSTTDMGCFAEWSASGQSSYTSNAGNGGGGLYDLAAAVPMGDSLDRLYMVGSGGDMFSRTAELDRVLVGGSFDPTFAGGQVQLDPGGSPPAFYLTLRAVAVQPDGRILIAGSRTDTTNSTTVPVVGRFWP